MLIRTAFLLLFSIFQIFPALANGGPTIFLKRAGSTSVSMTFKPESSAFSTAYEFSSVGTGFLFLFIRDDGVFVKDVRQFHPPTSAVEPTMNHDWSDSYNPNENYIIPLYPSSESRFKIPSDGKYFLLCFVKKGVHFSAGVKYSNVLGLTITNGRIVSSQDFTKNEIPIIVINAIKSQLAKIAIHEGGALQDFRW
jgi:hypothetical protein